MPVDIKAEAVNNLRFIRGAIERAERVSAVSGLGGLVMGFIALCAMAVASRLPALADQLLVWIGAAFIAASAAVICTIFKANKNGDRLDSDSTRRFLQCLVPILLVGALMSWTLWTTPHVSLLPAMWMLLYGCGLLAAGTYAVPPVMFMGACFLIAGLITYALPPNWGNVLMGLVFGGLHFAFGYQVFKHHGG